MSSFSISSAEGPAGPRFFRRHLQTAGNPFILIFNPILETEEML